MSFEENDKKDEIEIKTILIGNSGVGKTNLINTSVGLNFDEESFATTSSTFVQKRMTINNKEYILNIWDTAGQEMYESITKIFLKNAQIVVFVYSITDLQSFNNLEKWMELCKEMIDNDYVSGIVGNKKDLYKEEEQVTEEDGKKFAESKRMKFKLVSAKNNSESFDDFLEELLGELVGGTSKIETRKTFILKTETKKKKKKHRC